MFSKFDIAEVGALSTQAILIASDDIKYERGILFQKYALG